MKTVHRSGAALPRSGVERPERFPGFPVVPLSNAPPTRAAATRVTSRRNRLNYFIYHYAELEGKALALTSAFSFQDRSISKD